MKLTINQNAPIDLKNFDKFCGHGRTMNPNYRKPSTLAGHYIAKILESQPIIRHPNPKRERENYQLLFLNFLQILLNRNRLFRFVIRNFRHYKSNPVVTFKSTPLPIEKPSSQNPNLKTKQPKKRSYTRNPLTKSPKNNDGR